MALRIDALSWNGGHMYFHRTVRDRAAKVWRRRSIAVDVVVDRWRCRPEGARLLGTYLEKIIF